MERNSTACAFVIRVSGRGAVPAVEVYGQWPDGELSQHEHQGARLLVFGHCLLDAPGRSARFAAARGSAASHAAVADWPGSYSAIVLEPAGVTAYPDLAGQFPLYYSRGGGAVLIGSDPATLAARHGRRPDPVTLAAQIACPAALPLWWGRSAYLDVGRVEGGTVLRARDGALHTGTSGLPLPVAGRSLSEGAALLRAALTQGVRLRCGAGPVSSDFSGGLDSTTVALLAARWCREPVTAIAYHQPLAPAGDLADARRFAALDPRIRLDVVSGSAAELPFADIEGFAGSEGPGDARDWPRPGSCPAEPEPGVLTTARTRLRLAAAAAAGSGLHLTGEGGDAVLLASPSYLGSLARPGTMRALLRHCGGYARLRYTGPARLARRAVRLSRARPRQALRSLAAELACPAASPPAWADLLSWWPPCGEAATWLSPGARRQLAEVAADAATERAIPDGAAPADVAALVDLRRSGAAQRYLRQLARPWGFPIHAPFLDNALILAALGVPPASRAAPWAYKPLLGQAMAGLVPAEVLRRRTKGDYSGEDYRGARSARPGLRELLREPALADLGIIEPRAVRPALDRMTDGVAVPLGPLSMLLATEAWLRGSGAGTEATATC